ncbi:MAG: hypothetical protein CME64_06460 [Halobacteriovoraceae bacterium]|nr:hypothetical protein [Halobacteriovoraceae bacterium]
MVRFFIIITAIFTLSDAWGQFRLEKVVHSETSNSEDAQVLELDGDHVFSIGESELDNAAPSSVDDILRQAPSATTARGPRNSSESIRVRGLDTSKIFVAVDGVRQNFRGEHTSMITVDLENLKAVQIYENSADFSKGNSLGGGIQFVTKDPEDFLRKNKKVGGEFKFQSNSANSGSTYNAKNVFKTSKYSGFISLTSQQTGDIELNNGETLNNSSYEDFIGLIKLKSGNWTVSHEFFRREDDNPLDPSLNPPDSIQSLMADSLMEKNTTILKHQIKGQTANVYFNQFKTDKTERENKTREIREIDTVGVNFNKNFGLYRFGAEGFQDSLDSEKEGSEITSYPKAKSVYLSSFIERDINYKSLKATPGVRLNYYNLQTSGEDNAYRSAQDLSKKLKLKSSFSKESYLYASYSEGFNSPRVEQVYPSGEHSPAEWLARANNFIPNLDLEHEVSSNNEIGVSTKKYLFDYTGSLNFKASIYENKIDNYIKLERIDRSIMDDEDGTSQFINIPEVTLYGGEAELGLNYDIYEWKVSYAQVRGKNETENLFLEDLPADQYTYSFNVYLDKYRAQFGYFGIQAQEQNRTNPETLQRTEKTTAYFIHNIYGKKDIGDNFEVGLRIDNLGNKEYRRHGSFLNETREDYKLTFKYKVNTL